MGSPHLSRLLNLSPIINMSISLQPQSRFFSLPRELRDEIYRYYIYQEDGYHHWPDTNKLLSTDLACSYTYKAGAEGMRGIALQRNTITFNTILSKEPPWHPDRRQFLAGRCEDIFQAATMTKLCVIAVGVASITPDLVAKVQKARPDDRVCAAAQSL